MRRVQLSRTVQSITRAAAAATILAAVVPAARGQATQPTVVGTPAAVDTGSPKAAVRSFVTAQIKGDGRAIRDVLLTTNPTEERMAGGIADLAVAIADLDRAMVAKFGPGPTEQLMGDPNDALKANVDRLDRANEAINGETATVTSPPDAAAPAAGAPAGTSPPGTPAQAADGPSPQESMMLRKVNGQWKVSVSDLAKGSSNENIEKTLASVDTAVAGYKSVLADLNAGKLSTVEAVQTELNQKMMGTGAMPPGAPGGSAPTGATPPGVPATMPPAK